MTFARALITAFMTAVFIRTDDLSTMIVSVLFAGVIWISLTTDPLPGAIETGLQAFAKRYRRD